MSKKVYNKICKQCRKRFRAKRRDAKFCGVTCRKTHSYESKATSRIAWRYVHNVIKHDRKNGYSYVRMETLRNMSGPLFGTPGSVPEHCHSDKYEFRRMNDREYEYKQLK